MFNLSFQMALRSPPVIRKGFFVLCPLLFLIALIFPPLLFLSPLVLSMQLVLLLPHLFTYDTLKAESLPASLRARGPPF